MNSIQSLLRLSRSSNQEVEDELKWIYYVIDQVENNSGTKMTVEDIVVVIKEFGQHITDLKEKQDVRST